MRSNPTLIVFLGFAIYLMGFFPATYCSVPVKSQSMVRAAENGQHEGNTETMIHTTTNEQQEGSSPTAGWEEMEEAFVASSTGEGMEVIDMVQPEDSETLSNSAVKDLLLDLDLLLKIVFFLMHDIEHDIISVIMDDNNLNIYLCFMITYWTIQLVFTKRIPGN